MALRHETREQTVVRLLAKARQDGIRLYRDRRDGRYFASSASDPDTLHYVTGFSCDCAGFIHHGACKHHAALMAALGWIDRNPEPDPCPHCEGRGYWIKARRSGGVWVRADEPCPHCHGDRVAA